jgi:hypothetical protein
MQWLKRFGNIGQAGWILLSKMVFCTISDDVLRVFAKSIIKE